MDLLKLWVKLLRVTSLQFCLAGQERILWAFFMDIMGIVPTSWATVQSSVRSLTWHCPLAFHTRLCYIILALPFYHLCEGSMDVVNGTDIPCLTSVHSGLPAGWICRIACRAAPLRSASTAWGKSADWSWVYCEVGLLPSGPWWEQHWGLQHHCLLIY